MTYEKIIIFTLVAYMSAAVTGQDTKKITLAGALVDSRLALLNMR